MEKVPTNRETYLRIMQGIRHCGHLYHKIP